MIRVNPKWIEKIRDDLDKTGKIDITSEFNKGIQLVIESLISRNIPFRLYNLGAGIKRITTTTDICPCCKRQL